MADPGVVVGGLGDLDELASYVERHSASEDPGALVASVRHSLTTGRGSVVLAWLAGQLVGYARTDLLAPIGPDDPAPAGIYLSGLHVAVEHRRRGVGRLLTTERLGLLGRAPPPTGADGFGHVRCFVNARNGASIALHRELGFVVEGRAASYLGVTFTGGEGVLLRADLAAVRLRS